ncbi:hypothetical protein [Nonomuraea sp. NPDC023979]|uniref:hypothetical protein n=1 Tax=Nonomuraea sp. NPDC023979 TaxID=3154796 RepID=UPI0033F38833
MSETIHYGTPPVCMSKGSDLSTTADTGRTTCGRCRSTLRWLMSDRNISYDEAVQLKRRLRAGHII